MSTFYYFFALGTLANAVDIRIPSGGLRGKVTEIEGKKIMYFLNIPFAKPPIGELRFQEPVPYGAWKGIRAATEPGPICAQTWQEYNLSDTFIKVMDKIPTMSEDCLHLDVYVPGETLPEHPIPVMIWIHGGAYIFGDASSYDGSYIAALGEVIVVVIQYRLGVFGFLSSEDNFLPGNNGLKDQILAFKWVQANIASFGGDPKQVTIFGESAGSWSVSNHLVNAKNKGLFHKAIMQSGFNTGQVGLCSNPRNGLLEYGKSAGCLQEDTTSENMSTSALIDCLQGLSIDVLLMLQTNVNAKVMSNNMFDCYVAAVVDGDILRQHPFALLQDTSSEEYKFFQSIDVIAGCTSFEAASFGSILSGIETAMNYTPVANGISDELLQFLLKYVSPGLFNMTEEMEKILTMKLQNEDKTKQGIDLLEYASDIIFTIPMKRLLKAHINDKSNTYEYMFSYETSFDFFTKKLDWLKGVGSDHGTEILFLFGPRGMTEFFDLEEAELKTLRHQTIKYWSNFAKTGDPNSDGLVFWPQYGKHQGTFLKLAAKSSISSAMFDDRVRFLIEDLPSLLSNKKNEL